MLYQPDYWVVIKVDQGKPEDMHYRVFGSWVGGYTTGDSWRMNSGITSIKETEDYWEFSGSSGSIYKCHKAANGTGTSYHWGVLKQFIESGGIEILGEISFKKLVQEFKET